MRKEADEPVQDDGAVDLTAVLRRMSAGDVSARDELFPLIYSHLRRIAGAQMAKESPAHLLQPTALIHEAYLRLVRIDQVNWSDRGHFFAVAAKVMRQILITHARAGQAQKRRGVQADVDLDKYSADPWKHAEPMLLALNDALDRLEAISPRAYQLVELRFFAGLDFEEAAQALNVSSRTLKRDWNTAKLWLERELKSPGSGAASPDDA